MIENRKSTRNLCADLLKIRWKDAEGNQVKDFAVLEDISNGGACLKLEQPVPKDAEVRIIYPRGQFRGTVQYCVPDMTGYRIGVKFAPGNKWSKSQFQPAHLLRL